MLLLGQSVVGDCVLGEDKSSLHLDQRVRDLGGELFEFGVQDRSGWDHDVIRLTALHVFEMKFFCVDKVLDQLRKIRQRGKADPGQGEPGEVEEARWQRPWQAPVRRSICRRRKRVWRTTSV